MPEWEKFEKRCRDGSNCPTLAKIESDEKEAADRKDDISGYPTVILYKNDGETSEQKIIYGEAGDVTGDRTEEDLIRFLKANTDFSE
tara:strand:- start:218 stop:478 length:261 start_codon:yes stop_codon:yes gene_type:complete